MGGNRAFLGLLLAGAAAYAASFFGFLFPAVGIVLFWAITAITFVFTLRRLEYGLLLAFAELFLGSKGYLFSTTIGGASVSLRMALFVIVIGVWVARRLYSRPRFGGLPIRRYMPIFVMITWGIIVGVLRGNYFDVLLFDVNGYLFFVYLGPVFEVLAKKEARERFMHLLAASVAVQAILTVALAIAFARGFFDLASPVYRWVRVTGLGEITLLDNGIARVFFQSHIFALPIFLIFSFPHAKLAFSNSREWWNREGWRWGQRFLAAIAAAISLWLSLSRSFWVGAVAGVITGWGALLYARALNARRFFSPLVVVGTAFLFTILIIPHFGGAVFGRVGERDEPAASSRMKLLPVLVSEIKKHPLLGSGFGKTVTYVTDDPRVREREPSGEITTYAFEWGYLDFWVKMGIGGLLAYLYLLVAIFRRGWRTLRSSPSAAPFLAALAALAVTHIFSPYLNHPLGIGYLLMIDAFLSEH